MMSGDVIRMRPYTTCESIPRVGDRMSVAVSSRSLRYLSAIYLFIYLFTYISNIAVFEVSI